MKILLATDHFLPEVGGIERYAYNLVKFLIKKNHEVAVITEHLKDAGVDLPIETHLQSQILRKFSMHRTSRSLLAVQYIKDSYSIFKSVQDYAKKFDIVHYSGYHPMFMHFLKERNKIFSLHGIFPACAHSKLSYCGNPSTYRCAYCDAGQEDSLLRLFPYALYYYFYLREMKKSLFSFYKVICVSHCVRRCLNQAFKLKNLVTVHNFIDIEGEIKPALDETESFDLVKYLNLPVGARIITFSGRLDWKKGFDVLLSAMSKILASERNVYLVVTGSSKTNGLLLHSSLPRNRLKILGKLQRNIQLQVMNQSDVLVLPSRYPDALPTVLIEGLALGKVIVASNAGGIPEIIEHEKNGLLVQPGNIHHLSQAIVQALEDEELKHKCRRQNPSKARRFDIKKIGEEILSIYDQTLACDRQTFQNGPGQN